MRTDHIEPQSPTNHINLQALAASWGAPFVPREKISEFSGGILSARYLANLDCYGKGPEGRFKIGRKTVYPVNKLIEWMQRRSAVIEE